MPEVIPYYKVFAFLLFILPLFPFKVNLLFFILSSFEYVCTPDRDPPPAQIPRSSMFLSGLARWQMREKCGHAKEGKEIPGAPNFDLQTRPERRSKF